MAKQTKTTTKKTVVKKAAVKLAPGMQHECGCGKDCPCGCHKHGAAHMLKHILILAIVFALGMVAGKMLPGSHTNKPMPQRMHPVFTNGCLDMQSIASVKMQEALVKADVNGDNCISIEEYKAAKPKRQNAQNRGQYTPNKASNMRGPKGLNIPGLKGQKKYGK